MFVRRSVASGGPARGNRRRESWRGTAVGPRQSDLLAAARFMIGNGSRTYAT